MYSRRRRASITTGGNPFQGVTLADVHAALDDALQFAHVAGQAQGRLFTSDYGGSLKKRIQKRCENGRDKAVKRQVAIYYGLADETM